MQNVVSKRELSMSPAMQHVGYETEPLVHPKKEAELFFGHWLQCGDLDRLRADIDVTEAVFKRLTAGMAWRDRRQFERMRTYRKRTLALFNGLVTAWREKQEAA